MTADTKLEAGKTAPAFTLARPGRHEGEALRLQGPQGARVLLPEGRHARLHDPVVRPARHRRRHRRHRHHRHQPRRAGPAEEVRREVLARLPAARRHRAHRRREVRRVGREEELRPHLHGHHPLGVPDRREGQGRRGLVQDQPQGHARPSCSRPSRRERPARAPAEVLPAPPAVPPARRGHRPRARRAGHGSVAPHRRRGLLRRPLPRAAPRCPGC